MECVEMQNGAILCNFGNNVCYMIFGYILSTGGGGEGEGEPAERP